MQDKDSQKNLLLAIVLSVAVLLGWQLLFAGPKLKEEQERRARIAAGADAEGQPGGAPRRSETCQARCRSAPRNGGAAGLGPRRRAGRRRGKPRMRSRSARASDRARRACSGSIALKGGRIDDLVLVKYRETVEPKSPNVELFSPSGSPASLLRRVWLGTGVGRRQPVPGRDTVWTLEKGGALTPATPVTLAWDNGRA